MNTPDATVQVVTMRWRGHWRLWRWWITWLGAIAVIVAGVGGAFAVGFFVRSFTPNRVAIVAGVLGVVAIVAGGVIWVWRLYWRYFMNRLCAQLPPQSRAEAFIRAKQMQFGRSVLLTRATRVQWTELARSTGVITWLDERVAEQVLALPRTDRPIEPERIATAFQQFETNFGCMAAIMGAYQLAIGSWIPGIVWFMMAAVMGTRLALRGALFVPVVAGQGWVQHGRARWTVLDSVVVIQKRVGKTVSVSVVGPAGATRFHFSLKPKHDASLREFWRQWAHPNPRLEQQAFDA